MIPVGMLVKIEAMNIRLNQSIPLSLASFIARILSTWSSEFKSASERKEEYTKTATIIEMRISSIFGKILVRARYEDLLCFLDRLIIDG